MEDAAGAVLGSNLDAGNQVGLDPRLGPLADNGGPTQTHALLAGSPALDRGANPLNLANDQRGITPRVANGRADVGAYEAGSGSEGGDGGGEGGGGGGGDDPFERFFDDEPPPVFRFDTAMQRGGSFQRADVNGDGRLDAVYVRGGRRRPRILVVDGRRGRILHDLTPFGPRFRGRIFLALADVNDDEAADLLVGAGPGFMPLVAVDDG